MPRSKLNRNLSAFLDTIAWAEIGPALLAKSDDGYNVLVGSTPAKPKLFADYRKHPRIRDARLNSDAAGRYQFMGRYWSYYRESLHLPDFGPESQDKWAVQLIRECGAIDVIAAGDVTKAISLCRSRWASLPGAGYGQPEKDLSKLVAVYQQRVTNEVAT